MAEHSGPWSTGSFIDVDGWARMIGALLGFDQAALGISGVVGDPGSADLQCFGDSTGRQVKLPAGYGFVDGQFYYNDAQQTIALTTNTSGSTVTDRLVIRRSTGGSTCLATVIAGAPGAGPPALTSQDLQIAQIVKANNYVTINAGDVIDERTFIPRGTLPITATNPKPSSPFVGQTIGTPTGLFFWNGTLWEQVQADSGWVALSTNRAGGHAWIPVSGQPTQIRKVGKVVKMRGEVQLFGTNLANIIPVSAIPAAMRPAEKIAYTVQTTSGTVVTLFVFPDGSVNQATAPDFTTGAIPVNDVLSIDGMWLVG